MELEYTDKNKRRSRFYIGAGLIVALAVAGLVYVVVRQGAGQEPGVTMVDVVVAARDIPSRKPIEEGDLRVRSVPSDPTNESAFTRIDEVLGRVSGVSISAGQLITLNLLASAAEGQGFSILEAGQEFDPSGPDLRAVSVTVPDERAVAGLLQPGQRVDVVVTMAINPEIGLTPEEAAELTESVVPGPSTKVTLQTVTILARNGSMYILRTDLATAEKIAELQAAGGQFSLVLRPEEDGRTADTLGSTLDMLLDEFDFPVPKAPEFASPSPAP